MKPLLALALPALLLLGACTEQDICINQATGNLRATERKIDTIRENLARGYALHRTMERYEYRGVCHRKNGKPYECIKSDWRRVERPVPINTVSQRRELRALQSELPALREDAAAGIGQCRQTYPE